MTGESFLKKEERVIFFILVKYLLLHLVINSENFRISVDPNYGYS